MKPTLIVLFLLAAFAADVTADGQPPVLRRYRDLKVYSSSGSMSDPPDRIRGRTQFVNEGPVPLQIKARLEPCPALGFEGNQFDDAIAPGQSKFWRWSFTPPAEVHERQIIAGSITINERRERDLYISVLGTDPADLPDKGLEKITERARVVATYAPRTQESIQAEVAYRADHEPQPKLTLAADGKSDYCIVMEAEPASKDDVIGDLQRVIKLRSGVDLPIKPNADGPAIILRLVDLGTATEGLHDAYRLRTDAMNVIIESASTNGLRNGVYGLLTDHLGAHWFQPGALGEEIAIPKDKTIRLPALNEVRGSRWSSSNGASWGKARDWDRRNRAVVNQGRLTFGHNWYSFISPKKYPFDEYPEYYARDRQGKMRHKASDSNFCSTHPEVIEIVAKSVNTFFRNDPDAIIASLDPNDYVPMCLCDRCLALDKQYGQMNEDGKNVADRLLHFSKEIHDRVEPQFKDRYLGILIYAFQIELPKTAKPHPQHAGLICDMVWTYDHSRPWNDPTSRLNEHFYELVKGWGKLLSQFGYYDYYGHWTFPGPWGMVHKMREDLPAFRDLGGTFVMLEAQANFAMQGLNHYIAAQLEWNLDVDVDLAREQFFQMYYGPVAEPMRNYWLATERSYALERPSANNPPRAALRPAFWTELKQPLTLATEMAEKLPLDQKRFADRVKVTADGFDYAQRHFQYHMDFGEYTGALKKTVDHAAAVAYLRQHRSFFDEMQKRYSGDYWPPLVAGHLALEVEAMIKRHEAEQPKPK